MREKGCNEILISTEKGLFLCYRGNGQWDISDQFLGGVFLTCVVSIAGSIMAGTREGILVSDDGGQSWVESSRGMDNRHIRCIAVHDSFDGHVFAGTEPAAVYVSRDGGATWSGRSEVQEMRDRLGWYLPYSPEAGCIRSFAINGARVFAAAEVGGILRSDDGGDSWYLIGEKDGTAPPEGAAADDVHAVEIHALTPDVVFAATGGGLFRSSGAGNMWDKLYDCYCRAVWIDPEDSRHLIFSPATKKGWYGSVVRSRDGGVNWEPTDDGLGVPWPGKMIEQFLLVEGEIIALRSDGILYSAFPDDLRWGRILRGVKRVSGMAHLIAGER